MASPSFYGTYAGRVESVDDPLKRGRLCIRVDGIHPSDAPLEGLPWAVVAGDGMSPSITGAGSTVPYHVGDIVLVVFLAGRTGSPVITGSIPGNVGGFPSLPPEYAIDPARARKRRVISDRRGNTVELSENTDELHVRLRSGSAQVTLSQVGNAIRITGTGIKVEGTNVSVSATNADVTASAVTLAGLTPGNGGVPATGSVMVTADQRVDITADNPDPVASPGGIPSSANTTEVNIGAKATKSLGEARVRQSKKVRLRGQRIVVGVGNTGIGDDADNGVPLPPTLAVTIKSTASVDIQSSVVNVTSADAVNVSALGAVTVTAASIALVKVAP